MSFRRFVYHLTHWESWPYSIQLVPLIPVWCWYCLRSRSWWFFTTANPSLTFGGFQGEGKREMYDQLPPGTYPKSLYLSPLLSVAEAEQQLTAHQFTYPIAVKPNIGMASILFRRIDSPEAFRQYHRAMPVDYLVQTFIDYPLEVTVFYYRFPEAATGTITGFVRRQFLEVIGDGRATLWALLQSYERGDFRLEEIRANHANQLDYVVPDGEHYCLNYALNLTRGIDLVSLAHEKDDRLLRVFDQLSHYTGHFYYGRYDVKCQSVDDLKRNQNFTILEFNGAGAAPHHIYNSGHSLFRAYQIILHHWRVLYQISAENYRRGQPRWTFRQGWEFLKASEQHFQKLRQVETELAATLKPHEAVGEDVPRF